MSHVLPTPPHRRRRLTAAAGITIFALSLGAANAEAKTTAKGRGNAQGLVLHTKGIYHGAAPEVPDLRIERWESYTPKTSSYYERITNVAHPERSHEEWSSEGVSGWAVGRLDRPLKDRVSKKHTACSGASMPRGAEYSTDSLNAVRQANALGRNLADVAALPAGPAVRGLTTRVKQFDLWSDNRYQRDRPLEVVYDAATGDVVRTGRAGEDFWQEFTLWEVLPGNASIAKAPAEIRALCKPSAKKPAARKKAKRSEATWLLVHGTGVAHTAAPERGISESWLAISRLVP